MVLDLFSGSARTPRALRGGADGSASGGSHSIGRSTSRSATDMPNISRPSRAEDRELLHNCIAQVQRSLKGHSNSPSTLHTLASYYTKVHPHIDGRPFCVNLSLATFLFHLQMARIGLPEVDLYVQLICNILGQIPLDEQLQHPFVRQVLRDHVFGLPSPTCKGGAHCVVLVPQQQYRAFAWLVTSLIDRKMIPMDIVYQFQDKLEHYCSAPSPIVANRSLALLVQTVGQTRVDEQVTALQYVLKTRPERVNMDFLLACYERLKRAVVNPANGPKFGRALAIHCSELFLRFRSPIRREYVERFLYPSLCHSDMADFLEIPATREHLIRELLAQCAPGMGTTNSFYLCLCAVLQSCFDNEIDGALETVTLINCLMPHAAYFMSTLAIDTRMSVSMFARIIITLSRGAGLAMTGREVPDEVAQTIRHQRTSVYNVLFVLRESVRSCSITASRRATDMLKALRIAVPKTSIEALGKLSSEAFDGLCDITIDPQLLCAELAMVLHQEHIEEAMESSVQYFRDVSMLCTFCGGQRSASLLCPVNGTVHVTGQTSVSRVLTTLAECAGMKVMEDGLIGYLRNPTTQMDSATHYLIYHILRNAGQHRNALFISLEPHIRGTLMALVSADRANSRGLVSSEQKADTLMLHVKIAVLLSPAMDPSYLESIIKVFAELKLRNNHDALALWCFANILIRSCKGNVELLPTDPLENQYCVGYPNCAPSSSTCADNAQLLLRLMDRAHTFSQETKKLVGCCVCKLIQDYNMQSPNIVSTLLSSHGFIPDELAALHDFALPVGAGSTFWMFFMQQMKSSAPARTALMTALAKSIARRFRVATPAEAISVSGLESTGQVFAVMVFEALKRSPTIARVVLHMVSNWTRQTNHTPGKFVCLVYICAQLINVVHYRGTGPSAVELTVETQQDRNQFQDCVSKAVKVLRSQEGRLMKLGPLAQQDNPVFYALVRRLHRRVRRTVAVVSGEQLPSEDEEDDNVYGGYDSEMMAGAPDEATRDNGDDRGWERDTHPSTDDLRSHAMVVEELHQVADDSVFDAAEDYPHRHGAADHGDDDAAYDDTTYTAVRDTTAYTDSTVGERDDLRARAAAYRPTRSASRGVQTDTDATPLPHRPQAAPVGRSVDLLHPERSSTREKAVTAPVSRTVGTSPKTSDESSMTTAATPNRSGTLPAGASLRQTAPPRTTKDVGGPAWREPDLSDYVVEDITPIDKRDLPHLQATTPDGVILPSGMLLEYLRTHQGMDSLRDELLQVDHQWVEQHAASPWVSSMQHVAMEGRINNYDRPHNDNELAPHRTMLAEIRVRAEQEQRSMSSRQGAAVPPYGGDEVVDGEQHIAPVSGDPFLDEEAVGQKRSRTVLSAAPTPRGMNFFLQQNTTTVMSSALKEVRSLERQQPPSGQMPRPEPSLDAENRPPRGTPMVANLAAEGRPPVTPYGQMVIPSCFVEQKNDTAIRELHQVMGVHNPNDSRLSMAGKRRIAGSGAPAAEESTGSSVWWAEMSAAPMPTYATDPQYSMELF